MLAEIFSKYIESLEVTLMPDEQIKYRVRIYKTIENDSNKKWVLRK